MNSKNFPIKRQYVHQKDHLYEVPRIDKLTVVKSFDLLCGTMQTFQKMDNDDAGTIL